MVNPMQKRKNPLNRRLLRELRSEAGKYLVIFLLLFSSIGLISGFLVADNSMLAAYEEGFAKYNIENGNFTTADRMNKSQLQDAQALGITVYEQFYTEDLLTNGSTIRFYKNRSQINLACLMAGRLPESPGEAAIDRMYAENNALSIGDTLQSEDGRYTWRITGLIALPDYSCLFQNNTDTQAKPMKTRCRPPCKALFPECLPGRYGRQAQGRHPGTCGCRRRSAGRRKPAERWHRGTGRQRAGLSKRFCSFSYRSGRGTSSGAHRPCACYAAG